MNVDNTSPDTAASTTTGPVLTRRWWALAAVALGVSLIIMDATVVNVALPVIITDLHLDATQAEWMNAGYSLMFAALLLTVGRLGDLYRRRQLFFIGMLAFGAAMILPATLSTLNAIFTGRERAIAFAIWGSTIGGMAAMGPLVGSWLTTYVSWRWAFWINVPVGLIVLGLILAFVPETRDENSRRGLDIYAVLLSVLGLGGIVYALIEGQNYGWWRQACRARSVSSARRSASRSWVRSSSPRWVARPRPTLTSSAHHRPCPRRSSTP